MNKTILVGRLTKDPEIKYTQSQKVYATFTLAVRKKFKQENGPDADFFNCIAWNKTAEIIAQYVKKGDKIAVSGRLQIDKQEQNDGTNKYYTNVVVDEVELLGGKQETKKENIFVDDRGDMTWNLETDEFME